MLPSIECVVVSMLAIELGIENSVWTEFNKAGEEVMIATSILASSARKNDATHAEGNGEDRCGSENQLGR
jgi:hypothetical protein